VVDYGREYCRDGYSIQSSRAEQSPAPDQHAVELRRALGKSRAIAPRRLEYVIQGRLACCIDSGRASNKCAKSVPLLLEGLMRTCGSGELS